MADATCGTDSVVSCAFIQSNIDPICTNTVTGWSIINGPSCSLKGESYGCIYSSSTTDTTQILCCKDSITSSARSTVSVNTTATSRNTPSILSTPTSTKTITLQQNVNMCASSGGIFNLPIPNSYAYVITNPVGGLYTNDKSCSVTIQAPTSYVYIQVVSFVTESGYDIFTIVDGTDTQVYRNSGTLSSFTLWALQPLTLTFITDNSNVGSGVNLYVTAINYPTSTTTTSPSQSRSTSVSSSSSKSPLISRSYPSTTPLPSPSVDTYSESVSFSASPSGQTYSESVSFSASPSGQTYSESVSLSASPSGQTYSASSHISYEATQSYYSLSASVSYSPSVSITPITYSVSSTVSPPYTLSPNSYSESESSSSRVTAFYTLSSSGSYSPSPSYTTSPSYTPSPSYSHSPSYTLNGSITPITYSSLPSPSAYAQRTHQATQSFASYSSSPSPSTKAMPVLPNLTGISSAALQGLFDDMVNYDPLELTDTLNTLATAGLQGKSEFSVSTSSFSLQIKKVDGSNASLAVGSAAIQLPSFGAGVSAASVIKWTTNPYPIKTDTPVLAINALSSDSSSVSIKNLTTPVTMSWPYVTTLTSYVVFCDTGIVINKETTTTVKAFSFGNGTYVAPCPLNTTLTLTCTNTAQIAKGSCPAPIYVPECLYWNTALKTWTGDGCTSFFGNNTITCRCTHLTDFSTRIQSIVQDNSNIFTAAGSVYSLEGLTKYVTWYSVFGSIACITLIFMYMGHSCDRPFTKAYTESLLRNPVISNILQKVPMTPLSRYDKNSVFREIGEDIPTTKDSIFRILFRVILDNSRLQAFFRYDPRLGRMFRILTIFVIQFHSLFVTAFLYGFAHNDTIPMQWYDILFLTVITTLFNIPCVAIIMSTMNEVGKEEFIYKYPVLYDEYKRRIEFEKYALLYKNLTKRDDTVLIEDLDFLNDSDSFLDSVFMYLCCRLKTHEKEAAKMKRMNKAELLDTLLKIINTPYKRFVKHNPLWEFIPFHTLNGFLFLAASFGWLGWCLNYLLLFASYHTSTTAQNIMISYVTSEITTVFVSQPLTILLTIAITMYLHRHGDTLPWPLSLLHVKHTKRIPPVFYYSNPWNKESQSSLTSELAYTMFVKCPAQASQMDEISYAPLRSILDRITKKDNVLSSIDTGVKDLYIKLSSAKFQRDLTREFV